MTLTKRGNYEGIERRKAPRINDTIFFTYCLKYTGETVEGIAENIGGGGLMFKTDRPFSPATPIELEIYGPTDYKKQLIISIPALAKVVWVDKIEEGSRYKGSNRYNVGIQFVRIKKEGQAKVIKYIKESLKKRGID